MSRGSTARHESSSETDRARRHWDRAANLYDAWMAVFDRLLLGDGRAWLTSRASGEVLEIGVGTGRNLGLYPPHAHVTGVDLSPRMLAKARRRAAKAGRDIDLHVGDAQRLGFPPESFDAVVFSLALCSIPDDRLAVGEATRILRPGGRLVLLEHVRSPFRAVRAVQWLVDLCTSRLLCDYQLREPLDHLSAEGFEIEELHRSKLGIVERVQAAKRG